jgi:flavorubredoxin
MAPSPPTVARARDHGEHAVPHGSAPHRLPREVAPGTFWLGVCLEIEEKGHPLHNHNSCYLLRGRNASVLVDTSMPYGWPTIRKDIAEVLQGRPLDYVFPTHPEAPHMGNLGPLMAEYPNLRIVGDLRNYHLYYPEQQDRFKPMSRDAELDLGGRRLRLVDAVIHDLPNGFWGYDPDHRILFVSDAYPYTHEHEEDQCAMTSEELPGEIVPDDTSVVISRALTWIPKVETNLIVDALRSFLASHPVDLICPAHGGVITNPVKITQVFEMGMRKTRG